MCAHYFAQTAVAEQLRQRRIRQEQLERELMELNSMFFDLAQAVQVRIPEWCGAEDCWRLTVIVRPIFLPPPHEQKSAGVVSHLEQQVEQTKQHVATGTSELSKVF